MTCLVRPSSLHRGYRLTARRVPGRVAPPARVTGFRPVSSCDGGPPSRLPLGPAGVRQPHRRVGPRSSGGGRCGGRPVAFDIVGVASMLSFQYLVDGRTLLAGVRRVPWLAATAEAGRQTGPAALDGYGQRVMTR